MKADGMDKRGAIQLYHQQEAIGIASRLAIKVAA
jgi:hypothetical protein